MERQNQIFKLYRRLYQQYSSPALFWPQWCAKKKSIRTRELIIIGAVLTQRMSWRNVDIALKNLKQENLLSLKKISELKSLKKLSRLIRPVGFFQRKPKCLFEVASFIVNEYQDVRRLKKQKTEILRQKFLGIKGVGLETADTILLYALDKPVFVIDEYTKRLVQQNQLSSNLDYESLQSLFERSLSKDYRLFQDFHALIVIDQKGKQKAKMRKV